MKRFGFILLSLFFALTSAQASIYQIIVYTGYSNGQKLRIEGRVTQQREQPTASISDSSQKNLKRNLRQFFNKEGERWPLTLSVDKFHFQTQTDDEGYFRIDEKVSETLPEGWQPVSSKSKEASGVGQVLVIPPENTRGLISDIDDTILISEVLSKRRLLKNTFLKNSAQRQAVPGMARLYADVANSNAKPDAAPLFYLSGSPRQLYVSLTQFLQHNHFPPGVLITKRVSRGKASDSWFNQLDYKTKKIQEIFECLPHVRFILVGDDGERDPEIYDGIQKRFPDRVEAIWIRRVHPNPQRPRFENQLDLADVLKSASPQTDSP